MKKIFKKLRKKNIAPIIFDHGGSDTRLTQMQIDEQMKNKKERTMRNRIAELTDRLEKKTEENIKLRQEISNTMANQLTQKWSVAKLAHENDVPISEIADKMDCSKGKVRQKFREMEHDE